MRWLIIIWRVLIEHWPLVLRSTLERERQGFLAAIHNEQRKVDELRWRQRTFP